MSEYLEFQRYGRDKAKEMLIHRSGTKYSDSIHRAITGRKNVIAMHTHPCSMPPSIADFNSVYEHDYMLVIVICHNGKIYCYKSSEVITQSMHNLYVADYYKILHDEYEAQAAALNEMMKTYDILYWEVE